MEAEKIKSIIEAILFSAGRVVKINELILVLEKNEEEIQNIIENMKEDYVLYANVRGLKQKNILRKHILKNSLHSCITAIGMSIPQLIAGTIVVENVFAWPGIGKLCITSIFNRDYPVIQAYVLMVGVLFVVFNLIFDIIQYISDPRLRKGMN